MLKICGENINRVCGIVIWFCCWCEISRYQETI